MRNLTLFLIALTLCSCESIKKGQPIFQKNNTVVSLGKKVDVKIPNKTIKIRTTAYTCSERDHKAFGRKTAIGKPVEEGHTIAANWSVLPLGTVIRFAGNNYTVEDYGSFIKDAEKLDIPTIDVYQPSKADMRDWGVRFFDNVEIIQWGSYQKSLDHLRNNLQFSHCRLMYKQIKSILLSFY